MELERQVAARAAAVWAVMTDLDGAPELISGIESVERLDGAEGFAVGTRWRETRTMLGRTATEDMEVTDMEPGRSYTVEAAGAGAHYRSVVGVEPTGQESSRLWMTFEAQPVGLFAKVLAATVGKLFERSSRKALQADLDDIASAAEQGSQQ
jgi:carbon monoxide dehydrogenase subunit G